MFLLPPRTAAKSIGVHTVLPPRSPHRDRKYAADATPANDRYLIALGKLSKPAVPISDLSRSCGRCARQIYFEDLGKPIDANDFWIDHWRKNESRNGFYCTAFAYAAEGDSGLPIPDLHPVVEAMRYDDQFCGSAGKNFTPVDGPEG